MARLNKQDIKDMSTQDLIERIDSDEMQYKQKKFAHTISAIENPLELRWMRRDVARLKTELTLRKNAEENNNK